MPDSITCFGELLVDMIALSPGKLTTVDGFLKKFGGAPTREEEARLLSRETNPAKAELACYINLLERETGLEPATFSLATRRSTTELLPQFQSYLTTEASGLTSQNGRPSGTPTISCQGLIRSVPT